MTVSGPRVVGAVLLVCGLLLGLTAVREAGDGSLAVDGPRFAPLMVTVLWSGLALVYLLQPSTVDSEPANHKWAPVMLVGALVAYVLLLEPVGFALASAAFFVGAARILGSRQLLRDVLVAVPLAFGVYLSFTQLLDIRLPAGVLPL
ncbi:hypothetical protein Val02_30690 [Virgisporangium aliadipatigenens]|uniref:DUF1468 domain-containing protein n=1 Tax=Virgisporangium aliadipatigenens TaxID=741659 RepID=A0A8J4DQX4_9ACTN|nr:tripartite tricarboxylate transporter TctB family protein [Virgisporangium aliadipatigenens]GIJ46183.1 hypothetical protein Val02_30690 [Virgisporangium aliadipatigenens]